MSTPEQKGPSIWDRVDLVQAGTAIAATAAGIGLAAGVGALGRHFVGTASDKTQEGASRALFGGGASRLFR